MATLIIPEVTLYAAGFRHGAGTAWFYPISDNNHHVHVEATSQGCPPGELKITSVSVKTPGIGFGQNLRQIAVGTNAGKYDLATPNVDWGANPNQLQNALRLATIGVN
jgi:hypothetical protein